MTPSAATWAEHDAAPPLSFEALYDAHVDAVWRTLQRLGVEPGQVEDAAQEVFVTAWKRLADFGGRSSLKTWLVGIALNVASRSRRSSVRRDAREQASDVAPAAGHAPDEALQRKEGLVLLQRVLGALTDEQREVFVMMELEGLSAPETAALAGAPVNTIYSRLRLARAAFNAAVARLRAEEKR